MCYNPKKERYMELTIVPRMKIHTVNEQILRVHQGIQNLEMGITRLNVKRSTAEYVMLLPS